MRNKDDIDERLAIRDCEALKIDADTAEVTWSYCYPPHPYDVDEDLQEEEQVVGRVYLARRSKSDIWVCFYDLRLRAALGGGRAFRRWLLWSRHSMSCVALGL
jgi:hypothetical protein